MPVHLGNKPTVKLALLVEPKPGIEYDHLPRNELCV